MSESSAAGRPVSDRLALGLGGVWERVREAEAAWCATELRDVAFDGKWLFVRLANGCCGRAFAFAGAHGVHGPFDFAAFDLMRRFVGAPLEGLVAWTLSPEGVRDLGGHLAGAVCVAAMNAVCAPGCNREAFEARGLRVVEDCVGATVRPGDRVAVVGAGMFMRELASAGLASLDIIEMRPACDLMRAHVSAAGVETFPKGISFRPVEDTAPLFAEADVLLLTGSTLVNGTLFDLMRLPRRAREVVLFGPSASMRPEVLFELGATCVTATVLDSLDAFLAGDLCTFEGWRPPEGTTHSYTVIAPRP